jgi:transcriptional regulator with XRE-family HTH domain
MTFREKIVRLRKMKSLTQDEFATAVGVSRQAVYKWESGQSYPEVLKLIEIKMLFGISIDDLLDDTYEIEMPEKKKKRISRADKRRIEAEVRAREDELTSVQETAEPEKEEAITDTVSEISEVDVTEEVKEADTVSSIDTEELVSDEETVNEEKSDDTVNETADHTEETLTNEAEETEKKDVLEQTDVTDTVNEEDTDTRPREKRGFFQRLFGKK